MSRWPDGWTLQLRCTCQWWICADNMCNDTHDGNNGQVNGLELCLVLSTGHQQHWMRERRVFLDEWCPNGSLFYWYGVRYKVGANSDYIFLHRGLFHCCLFPLCGIEIPNYLYAMTLPWAQCSAVVMPFVSLYVAGQYWFYGSTSTKGYYVCHDTDSFRSIPMGLYMLHAAMGCNTQRLAFDIPAEAPRNYKEIKLTIISPCIGPPTWQLGMTLWLASAL